MPLASVFSLHWYGPAAAASLVEAASGVTADLSGVGGVSGTISGVASVPLAKPTRLVNSPATVTGSGSIPTASPKANARITSTIKVNELTQDDVTGAVLEAEVEPGLTLKQALIDARKAAKLSAALSA